MGTPTFCLDMADKRRQISVLDAKMDPTLGRNVLTSLEFVAHLMTMLLWLTVSRTSTQTPNVTSSVCELEGGLCIPDACDSPATNLSCSNVEPCCVDYDSERYTCGGIFMGTRGIIESPNYPGVYPGNLDCTYIIFSPHYIHLYFTEFELTCYDFLQIYDGPSSNYPTLTEQICGYGYFGMGAFSTQPYMTLVFKTDGFGEKTTGFQASWQGITISATSTTSTTPNPATTVPESSTQIQNFTSPVCELEGGACVPTACDSPSAHLNCSNGERCCLNYFSDPASSCGGIVKGTHGTITSPGYPADYEEYLYCKYVIFFPQSIIILIFIDFDIEYGYTCRYDHIQVFDGPSSAYPQLTDPLCSSNGYPDPPTAPITSTQSYITLEFITDGSASGRGFQAVWQACDPGSHLCTHGDGCYSEYQTCDGDRNCEDGSDEVSCWACDPTHPHQCADGEGCVSDQQICDGYQDCEDASDEGDCPDDDHTSHDPWYISLIVLSIAALVIIYCAVAKKRSEAVRVAELRRRAAQIAHYNNAATEIPQTSADEVQDNSASLSPPSYGEYSNYPTVPLQYDPSQAVPSSPPPCYVDSQAFPSTAPTSSLPDGAVAESPPAYESVSHITLDQGPVATVAYATESASHQQTDTGHQRNNDDLNTDQSNTIVSHL